MIKDILMTDPTIIAPAISGKTQAQSLLNEKY